MLHRQALLRSAAGHRVQTPASLTPSSHRARCSSTAVRAQPQRNDEHSHGSASVPQSIAACLAATLIMWSGGADARPEGVNRPDLLPSGEVTPVIDVAGFLTPSEEKRVATEIENLERDTGFRLRLLAQSYPETPGLAIRDYWKVDDNTIVFVADPTFGDILNFNVGAGVDLDVPRSFWGRLAGQYGNKFYWQEKGENESILNAVSAIDTCLREPPGRFKCAKVQAEFGEKDTGGKFSSMFGQ